MPDHTCVLHTSPAGTIERENTLVFRRSSRLATFSASATRSRLPT